MQPKEEGSQNWCSKDAYMVALIHIVSVYALALLFFVIVLLIFIYAKCCLISHIIEDDPNNISTVES